MSETMNNNNVSFSNQDIAKYLAENPTLDSSITLDSPQRQEQLQRLTDQQLQVQKEKERLRQVNLMNAPVFRTQQTGLVQQTGSVQNQAKFVQTVVKAAIPSGDIEEKNELFKYLVENTGQVTSKKYVTILKAGFDRCGFDFADILVMLSVYKSLPMDSKEMIAQHKENRDKAHKQNPDHIKQVDDSASNRQTEAVLPVFKALMEKLEKYVGRDSRQWGTFSQLPLIQNAITAIAKSNADKSIMNVKKLYMGSSIYNSITFKEAMTIMDRRWLPFSKAIKILGSQRQLKKVEKYADLIQRGTSTKTNMSEYYALVNPQGIPRTRDTMSASLAQVVSGTDPDALIAVSLLIDYRYLSQTSDFKQNKGTPLGGLMVGKILAKMAKVIHLATGVKTNLQQPLSFSVGTPFTEDYFTALRILNATKRNIDLSLYGRKGGQDTRTGKLQGVLSEVTYGFSLNDI